jgi:HD-like signal output (HDOD) protein
MAKLILFGLALLALPLALFALLRSGRRPPVQARAAVRSENAAVAPAAPAASTAAAEPQPPGPALQAPAEVAARLHALAFGVPLAPPGADRVNREVAAAVDVQLTGPVLKPEYAPRRPLLLPKLTQAVNDESVSRRELSVLIAQDPALAGNLLRLANSAFYRVNAQPVESIDRAVALLGTTGIRSLLAAALVQPVFRSSSGFFQRFPDVTWEHTQYAATAAEAHAALVADEDPFAGQLLALMYGLGSIIAFRAAMDEYARRRAAADAGTVSALIGQLAATVARRIAHDWELSERILTALEEQSPYARTSGTLSGLGESLRFGRYCASIGVLRHARVLDEEGALAAVRGGGFSGAAPERIWARLAEQLAREEQT